MDALLAQLERDPGRTRRAFAGATALSVVVAGGAYGIARYQARQADACSVAPPRIGEVWGGAQRAALAAAFTEAGPSYGEEVTERVTARLDAYTTEWSRSWAETCERARREELSDTLTDLRYACLDERLGAAAARIEVLRSADAETVEKATQVIATLPRIAPCSDNVYLQSAVRPPDDPARARQVAAARERLMVTRARIDAGKYVEGAREAVALLEEARGIGYAPLVARAGFVAGVGQVHAGEHKAAVVSFEDAYHEALAAGDDELAALASANLVLVLGGKLIQLDDARRWVRHAKSLVKRVGEDTLASENLENALGGMEQQGQDFAAAERHYRRAIELSAELHGPQSARVALLHSNLAGVLASQQRWDELEDEIEEALRLMRAEFGPSHPILSHPLSNLASGYIRQGRYDDALRALGQAIEIRVAALGPDDFSLSILLLNKGTVQDAKGELAGALKSFKRALENPRARARCGASPARAAVQQHRQHPPAARRVHGREATVQARARDPGAQRRPHPLDAAGVPQRVRARVAPGTVTRARRSRRSSGGWPSRARRTTRR